MWIIYTMLYVFFMALVLYIDEHLATTNKLPEDSNLHTKVGSVLLISALMNFFGAAILGFTIGNLHLPTNTLILSLLSAVPLITMFGGYFYLLQTYPVHQVGPLFQFGSIWLLMLDLATGSSLSIVGIAGMLTIMYGSYILDTGTFKWKVPTKLLFIAIPATSTWALMLFLTRVASQSAPATVVTFWQMIGAGIIGVLLFLFVKEYRRGFLYRIQHQGKKFLTFSLFNETFSQTAYLFSNLAVAIAPAAAYVSALGGVESVVLLGLFLAFPHGERVKITKMQWIAVGLIAFGVFLIERR